MLTTGKGRLLPVPPEPQLAKKIPPAMHQQKACPFAPRKHFRASLHHLRGKVRGQEAGHVSVAAVRSHMPAARKNEIIPLDESGGRHGARLRLRVLLEIGEVSSQ